MDDTQEDMDSLNQEKNRLAQRRESIVARIVEIKSQLVHTLPLTKYTSLQSQRSELVRQLQEVEAGLSRVSREFAAIFQKVRLSNSISKQEGKVGGIPFMREVIAIRDEYQEFAADMTRSPTMRRMASEFVVKLTPIIRKALSKNQLGQIE